MEATRPLSRNEKLAVINEEVDRLEDRIRAGRREIAVRLGENARIDFLAALGGGRSPQMHERYSENRRVIDQEEKAVSESTGAVEKLHEYTERELKTTLRSWY